MITVASYNIRKAIGTDRRRLPERTLEVLREIGADIVALQEADRRFGAKHSALPVEMLAEHSAYHAVPFNIRPGGIGWHGNAILIHKRAKLLACEVIALPTLEPRGAVMAEIDVRGSAIRVIGMHLDLSGLWRRKQARTLIRYIHEQKRRMPTVLMGDLNEWSPHGGCLRDFAVDHHLAPTGRSFHSRRPLGCLDRIILSRDIAVVASGVHVSAKARMASDHLPVWARIVPTSG